MIRVDVDPPWDLEAWRDAARRALCAAIPPEAVVWNGGAQDSLLPGADLVDRAATRSPPAVPRALLELAASVLCHHDAQRHALLYRLLWRIVHGEPRLLDRATDADVRRARDLDQSVRRAVHKMKAFVRFRAVTGESNTYVAWFEPEHAILHRVAPFFARRFAGMRWAILTPEASVQWDGTELAFGPGGTRADAPSDDAHETLWRTYYEHIFNPARLNPKVMQQQMPKKYWRHLPEAEVLPRLVRDAGARVQAMAEREAAAPRRHIPKPPSPSPDPVEDSLAALRKAARDCRACPLWEPATQTVFGEGPDDARVMLVGEQPGDREDLAGKPFVGPSGQVLDRALAELGLDRSRFYVTNAVKHFRFERRGQIRQHRNPEPSHVQACRQWLERELASVKPDIVVCLGATAALAVFGRGFRLLEERGVWQTLPNGVRAFATVHPSWILRHRDAQERETAYANFRDDLALLLNASS